jgi:hypothetical protein
MLLEVREYLLFHPTDLRAAVRGGSDLIVRTMGQPRRSPEHEGWDAPLPEHSSGANTELWFTGATGRAALPVAETRLRVSCLRPGAGGMTFPCVAFDDWESYIWLFERAGAAVTRTPILPVDGRIVMQVGADGTLVAKTYEGILWIDPNRRMGVRFPYPRRPEHLFTA